jgi:hypothetical protein
MVESRGVEAHVVVKGFVMLKENAREVGSSLVFKMCWWREVDGVGRVREFREKLDPRWDRTRSNQRSGLGASTRYYAIAALSFAGGSAALKTRCCERAAQVRPQQN